MKFIQFFCSALALSLLVALSAARPIAPVASCPLPAPASLSTTRTGSTTAYLEWSAVTDAISYRLIVYELGSNASVSNTVVGGTSITLGGLEAGKAYRVVLASMCSGGSISEFVIVEDIVD